MKDDLRVIFRFRFRGQVSLNNQLEELILYFDQGFYKKYITLYHIIDHQQISDFFTKYKIKSQYVHYLIRFGDLDEALLQIGLTIAELQDINDSEISTLLVIELILKKAFILLILAQLEEAKNQNELAESMIQEMASFRLEDEQIRLQFFYCRLQIMRNYGLYHQMSRNFEKSFEYLFKSKKLDGYSKEYGSYFGNSIISLVITEIQRVISAINDDIARGKRFLGKYEEAKELLFESLVLRQKIKDPFDISSSYHNIGLVYEFQEQLKQAISYHHKALDLRLNMGLKRSIGETCINLGSIYDQLGDLKKSLQYNSKASDIYESLGMNSYLSLALNNIGNVYRHRGELDKSLYYLKRSLEIEHKLSNPEGIAFESLAIVKIHILRGNLSDAQELLDKTLSLYKDLGHSEGLSQSYLELSRLQIIKGELRKALINIESAIKFAQQSNFNLTIAGCLYFKIQLIVTNYDAFPEYSMTELVVWLTELEQIKSLLASQLVDQYYSIASILVNHIHLDKSSLETTLHELNGIISGEIVDINLTITAILLKVEILIRIDMYQNIVEKQQVDDLLKMAVKISESTKSHQITARVYILLTRISVLSQEFQAGRTYLETARNIAQDKGFIVIENLVEKEIVKFTKDYTDFIIQQKSEGSEHLVFELDAESRKLDQLISAIINERIEYLVNDDISHIFPPGVNESIPMCGTSSPSSNNESGEKCTKCSRIGLNLMLKQIISAHLSYWKCGRCYNGLTKEKIQRIIAGHELSIDPAKLKLNQFLNVTSPFLNGKLIWECTSQRCSESKNQYFNLENLSSLFG